MTVPVIDGDVMRFQFDRFDAEAYEVFKQAKRLPSKVVEYDRIRDTYILTTQARFADRLGVQVKRKRKKDIGMPDWMWDYQAHFTVKALEAKRYAHYWDCGLGKTGAELEFGRQVNHRTGARVLHFTFLNIVPQTIREAHRWYGDSLPLRRLNDPQDLIDFCMGKGEETAAITNFEKLDAFEENELNQYFSRLGGVVVDESSMLKTGGGKRKWALIKGCRGVEYKLSNTATPAPNDAMEYASQASFLETIRHEGEILWTFFSRDMEGNWDVKPHAKRAFYEFLSSWSAYLRSPAAYGFKDNVVPLLEPEFIEHRIDPTPAQMEIALEIFSRHGAGLFGDERMGIVPRGRLAQMAKGFTYTDGKNYSLMPSLKPSTVGDLVREDMADGRQVLLGIAYDAEADVLAQYLPKGSFEVLDGRVKNLGERERIIERTETGDTPVLVTKMGMMGYGRNLQQFSSVLISGVDDSFERMYQFIRRAHRYGQTRRVRVRIPYIPELEGLPFENVMAKARRHSLEATEMEYCYREALGLGRSN
jgi:hypothetical protein